MTIKLIVGLGNPTSDYENTRHNAGTWFVQKLARTYQPNDVWQLDKKRNAQCTSINISGHTCRLLIPTTYINLSGLAVSQAAHYYRIALDHILVAHDDLDLPPGIARLKQGGGTGGHNGLKHIMQQTKGDHFLRLRLGIGHPGVKRLVHDYVLSKPTHEELQSIERAIALSIQVLPTLLTGNLDKAMQQLHTAHT